MTWCSTLNMTAVMMTAASTAWSKSILMVVWFSKCFYGDLGYEGAVLHETGKADHDEGSCEQTPSLGLHPAGAVHSCPVDLGVLDQIGFNLIYLENEPVVGMEEKKDPTMLQAPSAIISWLASKGFPPAGGKRSHITILVVGNSQKAFAMATDSRMAMMGMMMKALPRLLAISPKVTSSTGRVWLATL